MDAAGQFGNQGRMDAALAFDAGNARERRRHHADMEMGFTYAAIGAQGAGMAGMAGAFIADFEKGRCEGGGEFVADGFACAHAGRVCALGFKVKKFLSLFFGSPTP